MFTDLDADTDGSIDDGVQSIHASSSAGYFDIFTDLDADADGNCDDGVQSIW